jgi:CheY-like chemotaxis protein
VPEDEEGRADAPEHGATIVLIEDDDDIREIVAEVLRTEGYSVFTAAHGGEGLALCRQLGGKAVSLVLLDFMMPVLDGSQVLSVLKGDPELEAIPVIVVSAASRQKLATGFQGIAAWLSKPVEMQDLLAAVREVLGTVTRAWSPPRNSAVSIRFLARRLVDAQELQIAIERALFLDIERVGRNLSAAGAQEPAFEGLVGVGTSLVKAARAHDLEEARNASAELQAYLVSAARANRRVAP